MHERYSQYLFMLELLQVVYPHPPPASIFTLKLKEKDAFRVSSWRGGEQKHRQVLFEPKFYIIVVYLPTDACGLPIRLCSPPHSYAPTTLYKSSMPVTRLNRVIYHRHVMLVGS